MNSRCPYPIERSVPVSTHRIPGRGWLPSRRSSSSSSTGEPKKPTNYCAGWRGKNLTVLFGQSGLGKSSLLQAGLFPRLRAERYLPVAIRLDHAATAPPLSVR